MIETYEFIFKLIMVIMVFCCLYILVRFAMDWYYFKLWYCNKKISEKVYDDFIKKNNRIMKNILYVLIILFASMFIIALSLNFLYEKSRQEMLIELYTTYLLMLY